MPENKQCCRKCVDGYLQDECVDKSCPCHSSKEEEVNYCDSRTPKERERDGKIEVTMTSTTALDRLEGEEGWENRIKEILLRNFYNDRYLWSKADLEFRELIYSFLQKNTQDVKKGFIEEMEKFEKEVKCPYNCFGRRCSHFETAIANIRILKNKLSSLLEKK